MPNVPTSTSRRGSVASVASHTSSSAAAAASSSSSSGLSKKQRQRANRKLRKQEQQASSSTPLTSQQTGQQPPRALAGSRHQPHQVERFLQEHAQQSGGRAPRPMLIPSLAPNRATPPVAPAGPVALSLANLSLHDNQYRVVCLFGCQRCNRVWFQMVLPHKRVSSCHKCHRKYEAIPTRHEPSGLGFFKCRSRFVSPKHRSADDNNTCGRTWTSYPAARDVPQKCYKCSNYILPILVRAFFETAF